MRYIKALIKTFKQMDEEILGELSIILGLILTIPCMIFESGIILIFVLMFVIRGFYLIFKEYFKEFIDKVKSNLD